MAGIPDAHPIFKHIEALIKTVRSFGPTRVDTGKVPAGITTVGGHILPYCVLWPGAGSPYDQEPVAGGPDLQGQEFRFNTTVAATETWAVLGATGELKAALTGARVGSGIIRPALSQQAATVLTDTDISPARPFLPLSWTLTTTRNPEQ
ncbi:hypothetical protein [Citricoccus sp. K5]|uniref:hypothetical protein n=1 Tax=Citricoccus sp. K5 TaxID=2653135 RepID=UPI0012F2453A|nr:hypothetical protein [Citricoccus sp. K5]VXA92432.1 hypothetical protein CITRIK5_100020 [Citricoccus sp. K5]VXA94616.1 hypothetical protein CITRIK5_100086 [Citricoccus sp. K5]